MKNIILIRNDRFGEFLLIIPAIRALKEAYPKARITLAVSLQVKELADLIEYIDEVFVWDEVKKYLRKRKFDLCVIFNPTKEAHIASFLAGIPVRVGYDRKWGFLLTHKIEDKKDFGLKHEIESNLELVSLVGAKTTNSYVSLGRLSVCENPEYKDAIAVHPYTSDALKQWPEENFRNLIEKLTDQFHNKVVIVGKKELASSREDSFRRLGRNVFNLVNKTSLVQLAQILKQCKLLVSCDSGPMHLACAVGTPVVALFRNDLLGKTSTRWGPRSDRMNIVLENSCLADISASDVFERIKQVLDK